ncbi:MAG: RNB domain-containing ribonuclease [Sterolibacterium sp.]|nr:RNB domain-containing ribonuclease [Sterolibacterium sp.]
MNVLFEEEGAFKAGSILADNTTSLQVELPTGKRSKVKSSNVLLRFATPAAAGLLERAEREAAAIDVDFLWEVCGEAEFGFEELAREYVGHAPDAVDAAAVLLRLHASPMYFHRKGRGRYRKAPPEILQAALAGLEKKRQQALAVERMSASLQAGQMPEELRPLLRQLLYKPDRNRLETKAFEDACAASGLSPVQLLERCGALTSVHDYHLDRFLFEHFSQGEGFANYLLPTVPTDLPQARVRAFSIDDAQTTEIDDAFSVTPLAESEGGGWRIGIHIAAPGLGIRPDDALGRLARERLSTVYMPGRKITMLPDDVVERHTLLAGRSTPAVSVYLDVAADFSLRRRETRIEQVMVVSNLRHHDLEPLFNEQTLANGLPTLAFRDELWLLWNFAKTLEAARGKAGQSQGQNDYTFLVDWAAASTLAPEPGQIQIARRPRGSPLDVLVAELMIVANAGWARDLADAGVAALYRAQTSGKVRMTTVATAHEGLGVDCYTWTTSPLRRHVDLLNQWQLIAWLRNEPPPFAPRSAELLAAMRDFELTYAAYGEFQRGMERYWCLRWLQQENIQETTALVLREGLVRLEVLPLVLRMPGLPLLACGTRIRLAIETINLYEPSARGRFIEALPDAPVLLSADEVAQVPEETGETVAAPPDALEGQAGAG